MVLRTYLEKLFGLFDEHELKGTTFKDKIFKESFSK